MTCTTARVTRPACPDAGPFVAPRPTHRIADAPMRSRVVLHGVVVDVRLCRWVGGSVLEVAVTDGSEVSLVFLGRREIPGVEAGRELTAAGTIWSRRGRRVVLNPCYWLHCGLEVPDA